jgi:hypothetical protein
VEEAEKLRLDITVMGADETASISDKLFTTPPAVVAKIKNLVDPTAK